MSDLSVAHTHTYRHLHFWKTAARNEIAVSWGWFGDFAITYPALWSVPAYSEDWHHKASSHSVSTLLLSFMPQRHETCRFTLPIGTLAEGRHSRLDSWKLSRARACTSMFSTHLLSPVVSWRSARRYLEMAYGPIQRPMPSGMKEALTQIWSMELAFKRGRCLLRNQSFGE